MTFDYKAWLKTAEDRLAALKNERASFVSAIDDEIAKLEAGIRAFSPLVEEHSVASPEMGLTDAIRQIFIESGTNALHAPTAIRDALLSRGIALGQKNPMAVVHQTLARLEDKKFVEQVVSEDKTYYRWTGNMGIADMMRYRDVVTYLTDDQLAKGLGRYRSLQHPSQLPASSDPLTVPPIRKAPRYNQSKDDKE